MPSIASNQIAARMASRAMKVLSRDWEMRAEALRVGILSGGGSIPLEIADSARRRGHDVHIVAIEGEADADFGSHRVTTVNWGQIGTMVRTLREARVDVLVIVGRVQRPELWRIRTDLGFFLNLPAIVKIVTSGGDDSVLRRVVRFFEGQGLTVVAPADMAPEMIIGEGVLGDWSPSSVDTADIAKGFALIRTLGRFDIGQGVIVSEGRIEAIEGVEGTDRMIERVAHARSRVPGRRQGVLVKRSKPGQDLRVDMPAIGPETIARAEAARLKGIAVEAGRVLAARRDEMLGLIREKHVFVAGIVDDAAPGALGEKADMSPPLRFRHLGRNAPSSRMYEDAERGLDVVKSLCPFAPVGAAVVVARKHVLSVEAGEGARAAVERAAGLKQWTSLTHRRRGVVALAHASDLTPALIKLVDRAGFAGVVLMEEAAGSRIAEDAVAAADEARISVLLAAAGEAHTA